MKLRVLVTGATGLLGSSLVPYLKQEGYFVIEQGRSTTEGQICLDLTDINQTFYRLEKIKPNVIVNLAALTNVDLCEQQPYQAYLNNVRTVESLYQWIEKNLNCFLIHISTDQVYDGSGPHRENDVQLTNYYGFSKYTSEIIVSRINSTILRTNFFGRSFCHKRQSFSDWVVDSLKKCQPIKAVTDILFSPLSILTLVSMISLVIHEEITGIFNLGSHSGMSKADFIFKLAETLNLPRHTISQVKSQDLQLNAYRPKDMRMDVERFETTFNVTLPTLDDEILSLRRQYGVLT